MNARAIVERTANGAWGGNDPTARKKHRAVGSSFCSLAGQLRQRRAPRVDMGVEYTPSSGAERSRRTLWLLGGRYRRQLSRRRKRERKERMEGCFSKAGRQRCGRTHTRSENGMHEEPHEMAAVPERRRGCVGLQESVQGEEVERKEEPCEGGGEGAHA